MAGVRSHNITSLLTTSVGHHSLKSPLPILYFPYFFKPISPSTATTTKSILKISRLGIRRRTAVSQNRSYRLLTLSALVDGGSEASPEEEPEDPNQDAALDIRLPRRSLLVKFTCNECGERSQRLINRLAYERGLVFVQCAGCERYHKLADNLGLVIECDLREEADGEPIFDEKLLLGKLEQDEDKEL